MRRFLLSWLLVAISAAHAVPFVEREVGSDSGPPSGFEWAYEGLGALAYFGLVASTALLPERVRYVATPLALLSPILFWLWVIVFKA